jgi:TatD DNase family protein
MLIDAHAHLDQYEDKALDAALDEMEAHRILTIANSMDVPSYQRHVEIAERCKWVLPTFGIHPWRAFRYAIRRIDVRPYIKESPMLGEIGLDYDIDDDPNN